MEFIETKKITNNIAKITLTNGKKYNPLSLNVLRHLNSAVSYTHLTLPTIVDV